MSHRISFNEKTHACPCCKTPLTGVTGINTDDKPSVGDISVCYKCGAILTFGAGLIYRKMSDEILTKLKESDSESYNLIIKLSEYIKSKNN